jgi:hypothetical protein
VGQLDGKEVDVRRALIDGDLRVASLLTPRIEVEIRWWASFRAQVRPPHSPCSRLCFLRVGGRGRTMRDTREACWREIEYESMIDSVIHCVGPQTLARTVRGMAYHHEALRLLAEIQADETFWARRRFASPPVGQGQPLVNAVEWDMRSADLMRGREHYWPSPG